jgi:hypothetical protein
MFDQLNTVNTIGAVERDVDVDTGLSILKLDDRHFSVLERIYGLADARF